MLANVSPIKKFGFAPLGILFLTHPHLKIPVSITVLRGYTRHTLGIVYCNYISLSTIIINNVHITVHRVPQCSKLLLFCLLYEIDTVQV